MRIIRQTHLFTEYEHPKNETAFVYTQLAVDPTSEMIISWVTIYNEDNYVDVKQQGEIGYKRTRAVTKEIPESNLKLHTAYVSGLLDGKAYDFKVASDSTLRHFKTLPLTLPEDGIKIAFSSDFHPKTGTFQDAYISREMKNKGADIIVGLGDLADDEGMFEDNGTTRWLGFLKHLDDYVHTKNDEKWYIPFVPAVGNHDTTTYYDGHYSEAVGIRQFFDVPRLYNNPHNYGACSIGDYLQLIILDTHSAPVDGEQAEWLANVIDPTKKHVIPSMHVGMLPTSSFRDPNDEFFIKLRNSWAETLSNADNIKIAMDAHEHGWKRSVPLGVVSEKPIHGANEPDKGYFETNGKYLTEVPGGFKFFGDGSWGATHANRTRYNQNTTWYVEETRNGMPWITGYSGVAHETDGTNSGDWHHFHLITLKETHLKVQAIDPFGTVFYEEDIEV